MIRTLNEILKSYLNRLSTTKSCHIVLNYFNIDLNFNTGEERSALLLNVYLNYSIYDLNDEEFTFFFDTVLKKLPTFYIIVFAEIIMEKSLKLPQILTNFLVERDGINLLRLLIKYSQINLQIVISLLLNKQYIPILELNMVYI